MIDDDLDWKYLPVQRLRALLAALPDDARIGPNSVMNLVVMTHDAVPLAYVDFLGDGEVETF